MTLHPAVPLLFLSACAFPPLLPKAIEGEGPTPPPSPGDTGDSAACEPVAWHLDVDGDGFGNPDDVVWACGPLAGRVSDASDCDDSTAQAHPGLVEVCNDHHDNDCDGTDNGCALAGTLGLEEADVTFYGAVPRGHCGTAMVGGWDLVGGPGLDVALACVGENGDGGTGGAVHLIAASGVPAAGAWGALPLSLAIQGAAAARLHGAPAHARLGGAVAVGDLDGDELPDLVAGAAGDDSGAPAAGSVWTWDGATGAGTVILGERPFAGLGREVRVGDVDGDGADERVVAEVSNFGVGRVRVLAGDGTGVGRAVFEGICEQDGCRRGDGFGMALLLADLNGDGANDLVVGAPRADRAGEDAGTVYGWFGPLAAGGWGAESADLVLDGDLPGAGAGEALAAADVDDDGWLDLLVGAPRRPDGEEDEAGAVHVVLGPLQGGDGSLGVFGMVLGEKAGDRFGGAIAEVGDVDGDNAPDVVVGAPGQDPGPDGTGAGGAWLFFGPWGEDPRADGVRLVGPASSHSGDALAGAGDVNADGYADFLVGAPAYSAPGAPEGGAAFLVLGRGL